MAKSGKVKMSVPTRPDIHVKLKALAEAAGNDLGFYAEQVLIRHVEAKERVAAK